jgi:hypothetical protein
VIPLASMQCCRPSSFTEPAFSLHQATVTTPTLYVSTSDQQHQQTRMQIQQTGTTKHTYKSNMPKQSHKQANVTANPAHSTATRRAPPTLAPPQTANITNTNSYPTALPAAAKQAMMPMLLTNQARSLHTPSTPLIHQPRNK